MKREDASESRFPVRASGGAERGDARTVVQSLLPERVLELKEHGLGGIGLTVNHVHNGGCAGRAPHHRNRAEDLLGTT